ncbi:unnamed protein product, partial [Owenia fusiformis]
SFILKQRDMGSQILCVFTLLLCASRTDGAGIKSFAGSVGGSRVGGDLFSDVRDIGVECTPGSPYRYADTNCTYLVCKDNIYELAECQDAMGVTNGFKINDTATTNPCIRPAPECRKTLSEKGVADKDTKACGFDLCLVIDMSFSISDVNKVQVRSFALDLLKLLRLGDAFTLVSGSTYGGQTYPFVKFKTYNTPALIMNAAKNMTMKTKKGTSTWLALKEARESLTIGSGRRLGKKAVVVVFTDGVSNPTDMSPVTIEEARKLKDPTSYQEGITPPTVILVTAPNMKGEATSGVSQAEKNRLKELKINEFAAIPSEGSQYRYDLKSFDNLRDVIVPILKASCDTL